MNSRPGQQDPRRPDVREALDRDSRRLRRRDPKQRTFWRSLGVLGMVGWPIALASVGGALLGRYFDARWHTGVRYTLMLMVVGLLIGCLVAWKSVAQRHE